MSASKKNKEELELERQRQREEEQRAERRTMRTYAVVAVLCAVLGVAVLVMNTGILQRTLPAVTVNGTNFSAADVEYYYNVEYQNLVRTAQTYAMYGLDYGYDYTQDPAQQVYDEATGQTWEEYLTDVAKEDAAYVTALVEAANAEGYTLSAEAQQTLNDVLADVETNWVGNYKNRNDFLRSIYGPYITYDRFVELLNREVLASDYADCVISAVEYSQDEYDAYYAEHADELDSFTLTQFIFRAVPAAAEEGKELSEEEKAASLEQAKAEQKALAEELMARLEAGEDAEALAEEYADELYSSTISDSRVGSSVSTASYGQWALDAARRSGDVNLSELDTGTGHNYYVVRFEGRALVEDRTADVRHILVAAETDEGADMPNEAQFAAARAEAEELLAGWDGTEEGFAVLAAAHSADTQSAAQGGLITDVTAKSGFIAEFTDWSLDESRQAGDTGIVQNTGSSVKGWHIMYYVDGMPIWKRTADNALREADFTKWQEEVTAGYEPVEGFGMKFL